ncbi:hypothetical protein ES707_14976 [subsurface metagenome]
MINVIHNKLYDKQSIQDIYKLILNQKKTLDCMTTGKLLNCDHAFFKVLQVDRNMVLELVVSGLPGKLIVKYLCSGKKKYQNNTQWEAKQWQAVNKALRNSKAGKTPSLIAFDEDSGILLLEKVEGQSAHEIMKKALLSQVIFAKARQAPLNFYRLGAMLGLLHNCCSYDTSSPIYYRISAKLSSVPDAAQGDVVFSEGLSAFDEHSKPNAEVSWVHGNLRTDNILFTNNNITLIDMENAGAGDAMEDMGSLLAFIIMFGRFPFFPKRFLRSVITAILTGYCSAAVAVSERLLAATLGEVLVVYGRVIDKASLLPLFTWRCHKRRLRRIVMRLVKQLHNSPKELLRQPRILVA